jgi:type II secretory pathway pseudopilin PulG
MMAFQGQLPPSSQHHQQQQAAAAAAAAAASAQAMTAGQQPPPPPPPQQHHQQQPQQPQQQPPQQPQQQWYDAAYQSPVEVTTIGSLPPYGAGGMFVDPWGQPKLDFADDSGMQLPSQRLDSL